MSWPPDKSQKQRRRLSRPDDKMFFSRVTLHREINNPPVMMCPRSRRRRNPHSDTQTEPAVSPLALDRGPRPGVAIPEKQERKNSMLDPRRVLLGDISQLLMRQQQHKLC